MLSLETREVDRLLSTISAESTVIELSVDGATARTLIREIQRHPVKRNILHIDFQQLVAGEKVSVSVRIRFIGTADGVRNSGGIRPRPCTSPRARGPLDDSEHIEVDVTRSRSGIAFTFGISTFPRASSYSTIPERLSASAPPRLPRSRKLSRPWKASPWPLPSPSSFASRNRKMRRKRPSNWRRVPVSVQARPVGRRIGHRARVGDDEASESHRRARESRKGVRAHTAQRRLAGVVDHLADVWHFDPWKGRRGPRRADRLVEHACDS